MRYLQSRRRHLWRQWAWVPL